MWFVWFVVQTSVWDSKPAIRNPQSAISAQFAIRNSQFTIEIAAILGFTIAMTPEQRAKAFLGADPVHRARGDGGLSSGTPTSTARRSASR